MQGQPLKQPRQADSPNLAGQTPQVPRLAVNVGQSQSRNTHSLDARVQSPAHRNFQPQSPTVVSGNNQSLSRIQAGKTFYSTTHGSQEQGLTVYYNQLTPGQVHLKSVEQLEYENGVLLEQLHERDQIINMYKAGWQPNILPINDDLVRNLNLQLAQKNVLIQQFHRSLAQFDETVRRENLKLSSVCVQQFHNLQVLIARHEHYPILITQRLIDTSRQAETIYIKDMTVIQQYIFRLEETYKQVTILRQRLVILERDNLGLRQQLERQHHEGSGASVTLQQQITVLEQRVTIYEQQINVYKTEIHQYQQQITILHGEIAGLRGQLASAGGSGQTAQWQNQISALRQQVTLQLTEISTFKQQISVYLTEIAAYKKQIGSLTSENSAYRQQLQHTDQLDQLRHQVALYQAEITTLRQQINGYIGEINAHKNGQASSSEELAQLRQQISVQVTEINIYKQQITSYQQEVDALRARQQGNDNRGEIYKLQEQINLYATQINTYKQRVLTYTTQISHYQHEITSLHEQIEQYRRQLSRPIDSSELDACRQEITLYKKQISSLTLTIQQDATRYNQEIDYLKQQAQKFRRDATQGKNYQREAEELREKVLRYEQEIYAFKRKVESLETELNESGVQTSNLRRENQRLRNETLRLRDENGTLSEEASRLQEQISRLRVKISRLEAQGNSQLLEWKSKYQESTITIRRIRTQIDTLNLALSSGSEWKTKYENLQLKYKNLQQQIEYYKSELEKAKLKLEVQEKNLRAQLQSEYQYQISLVQERVRREVRLELQNSLTVEIRRRVQAEWTVRLDQSYSDLRKAEQYIQTLVAQIEQLQREIRSLSQQLDQISSRPVPNISEYQLKIALLSQQLTRLTSQSEQDRRNLEQAEHYIRQLEEHLKNAQSSTHLDDSTTTINTLNITIEELTIQIKEYIRRISEVNKQKQDIEIKYKRLDEIFTTSREDLELTIKRLNQEISLLKIQLREKSSGNLQWEREKKQLVDRYELELRERWEQLTKSEDYIANYTKESQSIISYLEQRIKDLEEQLEGLQSQQRPPAQPTSQETWLYKIDSRYGEIRARLLNISAQATQSVSSESEYWQSYKSKRKQEIQLLQQTISQSLAFMGQIEQAIVVKKQQLFRLDFTKLDTIILQLERLQKSKAELQGAAKQEFQSKFYGVLRAVSTSIQQ